MYWSVHFFYSEFSRQGFTVSITLILPGSLLLLTMQTTRKWIPFPVQKTRNFLKGGLTTEKFMEGIEQQEHTGFDVLHMLLQGDQGLPVPVQASYMIWTKKRRKVSLHPS
jgi:hypothetical protein